MDWADLKASATKAFDKMTTKRGANDILQKKRTGVESYGTKTFTKGLTGMFDEDELSEVTSLMEDEDSYDFSSDRKPSGRGR